jgi:acylphosphatase
VGFRYFARREAERLGIDGWVRNLPDGDVELAAEGENAALVEFREWLEEGPPGARIGSITVESIKPTEFYTGFTIEF